jgi:type IV secretion system protein VirB9
MTILARIGALAVLIIQAVAFALPAAAELSPRAGPRDSRIRYVWYHKDEVVSVQASYGASTMITFAEDERIETLGAGDALAWRIEPNKKGNVLFVKPVEKEAHANLNVLTNKRSYVFILKGEFRPVAQQVYSIVFRYPDEEGDNAAMMAQARERAAQPNLRNLRAENVNSAYGYKGASANKPLVIFDDGVKTFFRFDPARETPAIYVVDAERNESLINFRREGEYLVVDRVNYQWTLRNGADATCIFNMRLNNLNEPTGLEPHAPQRIGGPKPRPVRTRNAIS